MELTTNGRPVIVTGVGNWDDSQPRMGKFIEVQEEGSEDKFRYSIDKELELPAVGELVTLTVHFFKRPEARTNRSTGEAFVRWVEKRRVVALKAA